MQLIKSNFNIPLLAIEINTSRGSKRLHKNINDAHYKFAIYVEMMHALKEVPNLRDLFFRIGHDRFHFAALGPLIAKEVLGAGYEGRILGDGECGTMTSCHGYSWAHLPPPWVCGDPMRCYDSTNKKQMHWWDEGHGPQSIRGLSNRTGGKPLNSGVGLKKFTGSISVSKSPAKPRLAYRSSLASHKTWAGLLDTLGLIYRT